MIDVVKGWPPKGLCPLDSNALAGFHSMLGNIFNFYAIKDVFKYLGDIVKISGDITYFEKFLDKDTKILILISSKGNLKIPIFLHRIPKFSSLFVFWGDLRETKLSCRGV
jgi:hypothetical protein